MGASPGQGCESPALPAPVPQTPPRAERGERSRSRAAAAASGNLCLGQVAGVPREPRASSTPSLSEVLTPSGRGQERFEPLPPAPSRPRARRGGEIQLPAMLRSPPSRFGASFPMHHLQDSSAVPCARPPPAEDHEPPGSPPAPLLMPPWRAGWRKDGWRAGWMDERWEGCRAGVTLRRAGGREPTPPGRSSARCAGAACRAPHEAMLFLGACRVTQKGRGREGIRHPLRCGKGREGGGSRGEPAARRSVSVLTSPVRAPSLAGSGRRGQEDARVGR